MRWATIFQKQLLVWVVVLLSIPGITNAALNQEWVAEYMGPAGDDKPVAIALDHAGNVFVTGTSGDSALHYFATVKYDGSGTQIWEDTMEGQARDIAVDNAGNIYVTGNSYRVPGGEDFTTIKYDNAGTRLWVAYYDGPDSNQDIANAVTVDDLGNVYVTGRSDTDYGTHHEDEMVTIKYDNTGSLVWVDRYAASPSAYSQGIAIAVDSTGNVFVSGYSDGIVTIKYNKDGVKRWIQPYAGHANEMALDSDGNIYVTGYNSVAITGDDFITTKRERTLGSLLWEARWNNPADTTDVATDLVLDDAGNIYVTGRTFKSGQSYDCLTIKYDHAGSEHWVSRYNNPHNRWDQADAIALDNSGNVYITGKSRDFGTEYDYITIQYDNLGNELDIKRYNGPDSLDDNAVDIAVDNSGNVYVTGQITRSGQFNYATIKYSTMGPPVPVGNHLALLVLTITVSTWFLLRLHRNIPDFRDTQEQVKDSRLIG